MGQVCAKHEQFYEIECPWCVPSGLAEPAWDSKTWPAALDFIPLPFRFMDAETGKPVPLVGKHFRSPTFHACALCGLAGDEIEKDPTIDCNPPVNGSGWPQRGDKAF